MRRGVVVVAAMLALLAAGCTEDDPETELPCAFWVNQFETGAVERDAVPEECRSLLPERTETPVTTEAPATTETTAGG